MLGSKGNKNIFFTPFLKANPSEPKQSAFFVLNPTHVHLEQENRWAGGASHRVLTCGSVPHHVGCPWATLWHEVSTGEDAEQASILGALGQKSLGSQDLSMMQGSGGGAAPGGCSLQKGYSPWNGGNRLGRLGSYITPGLQHLGPDVVPFASANET